MRYVEITAKTVEFLWHGTSSKNLKSILSKGLMPDGKYRDVQYGKGHYKSIHGIYLATSLQKALNYAEIASKRTFNEVLILVKASYDNENFALDEDNINKYFFRNSEYKTTDESFQAFVNYYLQRIKSNAHKAFIYTCNKNKKLIIDWIFHDTQDDLSNQDETEREYIRKITLLLGKFLTSKIKKYDTYHGYDENWKNIATNKPITYKGATRIIGIWLQANRKYGRKKELVQVYGDKKYNTLLNQRFKKYSEYKLLDELHGMEDYDLYNDLLENKDIDWNVYVKKHGKLPSWLNNYFSINPDLHTIPENFSAEKLYVNSNIKKLPKGLKVNYLDLSMNDNIKRLPEDIQVKQLVTNEILENIPVDKLEYLKLNSHNCVEDAVDMEVEKLGITFPISEFPRNLKELGMSRCFNNVNLPKNMWHTNCTFSDFQTTLPNGFKTRYCYLANCEYMTKLPDNMTCDTLYVPPKLEQLPKNLNVNNLILVGSKVTEIPSDAKIEILSVNNKTKFPENFELQELHIGGNLTKDDMIIPSSCNIKEIT